MINRTKVQKRKIPYKYECENILAHGKKNNS